MSGADMPVSEVLDLAADLIEERGWQSGGGWQAAIAGHGPLCIEGGIIAAAGLKNIWTLDQCPAYHAVRDYLDGMPPYVWNDFLMYDRSDVSGYVGGSVETALEHGQAQVIATLRAASAAHATREAPVTLTGAVAK